MKTTNNYVGTGAERDNQKKEKTVLESFEQKFVIEENENRDMYASIFSFFDTCELYKIPVKAYDCYDGYALVFPSGAYLMFNRLAIERRGYVFSGVDDSVDGRGLECYEVSEALMRYCGKLAGRKA